MSETPPRVTVAELATAVDIFDTARTVLYVVDPEGDPVPARGWEVRYARDGSTLVVVW